MSRLTGLIIEGAAHPWPEALGHAVLQIPPSAAAEPRTDLIGPGCHDIVLDTKSWTFSDLEQRAVVAVP